MFTRVLATPTAIYLVGFTKSFASYTLYVNSIDPVSGALLSSASVPSDIPSLDNFLLTVHPTPRVVWLERNGYVRSVILTPELKSPSRNTVSGSGFTKIIDVGLEVDGLFVVLNADGSSRVMRVTEAKGIVGIWDFDDSARSASYEESIYSGGYDRDARPYISRTHWSHSFNVRVE